MSSFTRGLHLIHCSPACGPQRVKIAQIGLEEGVAVGAGRQEKLFMGVERPARYAGGELNSARLKEGTTGRMALVFPDTYEIGMSHVGMRLLYHLVNEQKELFCERAFHPWVDMEEALRKNEELLCTLETGTPLKEMPLIGFSLAYEMLYNNFLNVLSMAQIPFYAKERDEEAPIIIVGGPCTYNPEPIVPFIDLAILGEGEAVIVELCKLANDKSKTRAQRLAAMAQLPGVYNPADFEIEYDDKGRVSKRTPADKTIEKAWAKDLNKAYFPCQPIVPSSEIVHDRANLEIHRGCIHGCRFCQAGYIYRPLRVRSKEQLLKMSREILKSTGYEELGLVSLNSIDHPDILPIVSELDRELNPKRISIGLPSLRMDAISFELTEKLGRTKKTNITLAPEAGSQKLRDIINKNLSEKQIIESVDAFINAGWQSMKLYFMIGLPGETDEDVEAIVDLVKKIIERGKPKKDKKDGQKKQKGSGRNRPFKVTVNVSSFVAKSHTPFQWEPMTDLKVLRDRMNILITGLSRNKRVSLKWRDFELGLIEGLLARGDRRLAPVLKRVYDNGGVMESWSDKFDFQRWLDAMEEEGLEIKDYVYRQRDAEEQLPWDHLSCGVTREYLVAEWKKAKDGVGTKDCLGNHCTNCGFGPDCPTKKMGEK